MKTIIKKTLIVIILSACLYGLKNLLLEKNTFQSVNELLTPLTLPVIILVAVILVGIQTFLSYKNPPLSEQEMKVKIKEYIFAKFTPEQMAIVEDMSEEDKERFVEEMLKLQSPEEKAEMNSVLAAFRFSNEPANLRIPKKLVKIALIAAVLFSGYFVYQKVSPEYTAYMAEQNAIINEVIADQVLYLEGLPPIQLESDNTFTKMQIDKYIERNIRTQPSYLLKNAKMIHLCNEDKFLQYENIHLKPLDGVAAFTHVDSIIVNINALMSSPKTTVTHELSHVYYNYDNSYYTNFVGAIDFGGNDSYYNSSAEEFMAQTSAMYVNNPESLKSQCPELYNYFASIYAQ